MKNQSLRFAVQEAVREEVRKGYLTKTKDILEILPEIIDTVQIDKRKMRTSVERCLSTSNPINAILNLFGMQIIQKEKTIDSLLSSESMDSAVVESDESYHVSWLVLNKTKFHTVLGQLAQKLLDLENQIQRDYDAERTRGDNLFDKYGKLTKEHDVLKATMEANERMVAERVQYMLFVSGKEETAHNGQLIEMLKDLGIEVYWDCIEAPFTDAAMFTDFSVDDEAAAGTKPCLVRNGTVYVKGLRLIKR